jgi:hypothetical protein
MLFNSIQLKQKICVDFLKENAFMLKIELLLNIEMQEMFELNQSCLNEHFVHI